MLRTLPVVNAVRRSAQHAAKSAQKIRTRSVFRQSKMMRSSLALSANARTVQSLEKLFPKLSAQGQQKRALSSAASVDTFFDDYAAHVEERKAQGIVPLPLNAEQVAALVEIVKNPPSGRESEIIDLLVKADYYPHARAAIHHDCPHACAQTRMQYQSSVHNNQYTPNERCWQVKGPPKAPQGPGLLEGQ